MKIGDVARQAGVRVDTLRYYERRGLIHEPERRRSGYREYPPGTPEVIRFIKRAQDLGFSLEEVEELLRLRSGGEPAEVRALAEGKMRDIDEKLRRLGAMRSALAGLLVECACEAGSSPTCPIIEALDDPRPDVRRPSRRAGGARAGRFTPRWRSRARCSHFCPARTAHSASAPTALSYRHSASVSW